MLYIEIHQPDDRLKKKGYKKNGKAPRAGASRRFVDDIFPVLYHTVAKLRKGEEGRRFCFKKSNRPILGLLELLSFIRKWYAIR